MAGGWDSKWVKSQQADGEGALTTTDPQGGDARLLARRQTLQLARQRALAELQTACRAAHRATLEAAIAELERQINDRE